MNGARSWLKRRPAREACLQIVGVLRSLRGSARKLRVVEPEPSFGVAVLGNIVEMRGHRSS